MKERDQIDQEPTTIKLKKRLYEIRNEILDYLVDNEPDKKVNDLLAESDLAIRQWASVFSDYLVTDNEYYTRVTHRILEPVYETLSYRNGEYDDMEEELEKIFIEREKLIEKIHQLTPNY